MLNLIEQMFSAPRRPSDAIEVEGKLFEQVVRQYATCITRGVEKCNRLHDAIAKERAKPRRASAGGVVDTSRDSINGYAGEIRQIQDELREYRFAAACAYIAGGKTEASRMVLRVIGFEFNEAGGISGPEKWGLQGIPASETEAIRGVPYRAMQLARGAAGANTGNLSQSV